jgi:hypothetical protein
MSFEKKKFFFLKFTKAVRNILHVLFLLDKKFFKKYRESNIKKNTLFIQRRGCRKLKKIFEKDEKIKIIK